MDRPVIYLAGSIHHHPTLASANAWRLKATSVLEGVGYKVLNPLRDKEEGKRYPVELIVESDLQDISNSDILLVEMTYSNKPYIGTSMEIRTAYEQGKEIFLWGAANQYNPWLIYHASEWFRTLDNALDYLVRRRTRDE